MRTLQYGFPLLDLIQDLSFTHAQLEANPLTAAYAKAFADHAAEVKKAVGRQLDLVATLAVTDAKKVQVDSVLNGLVDQTRAALLTLSGNDRNTPLYRRLFGDQSPSTIKRPILGTQLELMRDWVNPLSTAPQPELTALVPLLTVTIKDADNAIAAGRTAEQALADFTEIGDCKSLIDKANALRKATYGKLAELVHDKPAAHLPADFADQFFLRESRWSAPDREELLARIARNDKQGARLRQQLQEFDDELELSRKSEREAQANALRTELAATIQRRAEEQAREAALQAQLTQLTGPSAPSPSPAST